MLKRDTNPKTALAEGKPGISAMPLNVVTRVGSGFGEGALKYGRHNWREEGVTASVYVDAAWRHLALWVEGEEIDSDSGLNHIDKAIASLMILSDAIDRPDTFNDDRPLPSDPDWMRSEREATAALADRFHEVKE